MTGFFSSGESNDVSPVEPMKSTARVPCFSWNVEQRAERPEIERAVLVERGHERDE